MEQLPIYIKIVFALTTLLSVVLLYLAANRSRTLLIVLLSWLAVQSALGLSGFYTVTGGTPPRFALLVVVPIVFILVLFLIKGGRRWIDGLDPKILTLFHIVRIPVELTLYWLYLEKLVPEVMTFEGRNFDILCGLTAPFVWYFGYVKKSLSKGVLLAWNILCLLLLGNIVVTAVLSAPFPFQKFGFDQPNIALFYFPFVWLPCLIVPGALFAHLAVIRRLVSPRK